MIEDRREPETGSTDLRALSFATDGRAVVLLVMGFLILCTPPTFFSEIDYAAAFDERTTHYPLVLRFSEQLPSPDISDYNAPYAPLYHLLLSGVAAAGNGSLFLLRGVNLLVSAGALILLYILLRTALPRRQSILAASTIALAPFFFGPSTRIMTDNVSLLFAMASLGLMRRESASAGRLASAGIMASAAVAIRQTYIWIPVLAAATLATRIGNRSGRYRLAALFLVLSPVAVLGCFVILWGGIVPPAQQYFWEHQNRGWINPSALYFGIALVGTYGTFYMLHFWSLYRAEGGGLVTVGVVCTLCWAALLIVPFEVNQATSPGPLEQVARFFPSIRNTPAVFYPLVPMGAMVIYTCALTAKDNESRFFLYAFVIWLMSSLGYTVFYQRYFEALVLFFVLYFGLQADVRKPWRWVGPVFLICCFVIVDVVHHMITRIS